MFSYERSLEHHLVFVNRQNGTCSSEEKKNLDQGRFSTEIIKQRKIYNSKTLFLAHLS